MKNGKDYLSVLTDKEREDFIIEFNDSNTISIESYLSAHYCNINDFIVEAFDFGVDYGYWESIIEYYTIVLAQEHVELLLQKKSFDKAIDDVDALIKTITHYSSKMFWQEVKKQLIKKTQ